MTSPPATAPKLEPWVREILDAHPEFREQMPYDVPQYTKPKLDKFYGLAQQNGHADELFNTLVSRVAAALMSGPPEKVKLAADRMAMEVIRTAAERLPITKSRHKRIELVSAADLARQQLKPPSMLIDKLWQKEGCGFFGGEPKTLKTYTALEMAMALSTDGKVFDHFAVKETGPVVLFLEETKPNEADQRLNYLCRGKGIDRASLDNLHLSIQRRVRLADPDFQDEIREICAAIKPVACFFDHLGRMAPDAHYAPAEVDPVLDFLRGLQVDFLTAVVLLDHLNRPKPDKPERGANRLPGVVKYAWMDCGLFFTRPDGSEVVQVEGEHREAADPEPFTIRRHEYETSNGIAVELKYEPGRLLPAKVRALAEEMVKAAGKAGTHGVTARTLRTAGKGSNEDKDRARAHLVETGKLIQAHGSKKDKLGRPHKADLHYLPKHAPPTEETSESGSA